MVPRVHCGKSNQLNHSPTFEARRNHVHIHEPKPIHPSQKFPISNTYAMTQKLLVGGLRKAGKADSKPRGRRCNHVPGLHCPFIASYENHEVIESCNNALITRKYAMNGDRMCRAEKMAAESRGIVDSQILVPKQVGLRYNDAYLNKGINGPNNQGKPNRHVGAEVQPCAE